MWFRGIALSAIESSFSIEPEFRHPADLNCASSNPDTCNNLKVFCNCYCVMFDLGQNLARPYLQK